MKDRGGLVRPSADVIAVCKAVEANVRQLVGLQQKPVVRGNVRQAIINELLADFVGTDIFNPLDEHFFNCEAMNSHRYEIIAKVASQYISLRLHHQAKLCTRTAQGATCRSICTKTVLFKVI